MAGVTGRLPNLLWCNMYSQEGWLVHAKTRLKALLLPKLEYALNRLSEYVR